MSSLIIVNNLLFFVFHRDNMSKKIAKIFAKRFAHHAKNELLKKLKPGKMAKSALTYGTPLGGALIAAHGVSKLLRGRKKRITKR